VEDTRSIGMKKSFSLGLLAVVGASLLVLGAACATGASKEEVADLTASLEAANSQIAALTKSLEPKTHNLSVRIAEGAIVGGETVWRWEPQVLVVNKGDKIVLEIDNPTPNIHSFVLQDFEVNSQQVAPGTKATVEIVAGQVGVFQYRCGTRFDAAQNWCAPDHRRQVGQLIVLER
jgi:heme/copper-type cytochrome/quinol oxidase subunit 2